MLVSTHETLMNNLEAAVWFSGSTWSRVNSVPLSRAKCLATALCWLNRVPGVVHGYSSCAELRNSFGRYYKIQRDDPADLW